MKRILPMMALVAWTALPLTGRGQATAPAKPEPPAPVAPSVPASAPRAESPPADDKKEVQQLVKDFGDKRTNLLEDYKAKLERLKQARTEEERRKILAELRQLQQARLDQQREIIRRMREKMQQTQRPNRPGG